MIDKNGPLSQLEASKSSTKNLFNDLLDETKGFKYQITVKILLKKYKGTEIEFPAVHFNSTTKTLVNHKFDLDKKFSTELTTGLTKDLVGLLNQLILNTSIDF